MWNDISFCSYFVFLNLQILTDKSIFSYFLTPCFFYSFIYLLQFLIYLSMVCLLLIFSLYFIYFAYNPLFMHLNTCVLRFNFIFHANFMLWFRLFVNVYNLFHLIFFNERHYLQGNVLANSAVNKLIAWMMK